MERMHKFKEEIRMNSPIQTLSKGEKRILDAVDFEIYHMIDSDSGRTRMHNHDFFEFFYLQRGQMDYIVEGNCYTLKEGSLLVIAPNELHRPDVKECTEHEKIVVWISPAMLTMLSRWIPGLIHDFFSVSQTGHHFQPDANYSKELQQLFNSLLKEQQGQDMYTSTMCQCLLLQLLLLVKRMHVSTQNQKPIENNLPSSLSSSEQSTDRDLNQVFLYINAHYIEDFTVSDLAERFFFNPNTLNRQFKKHTGMSVAEYIREKRLTIARLYMHQGINAAKAGAASGFSDYTTFYRAFCRKYGISPKAYAAHIRNQSSILSGDMKDLS